MTTMSIEDMQGELRRTRIACLGLPLGSGGVRPMREAMVLLSDAIARGDTGAGSRYALQCARLRSAYRVVTEVDVEALRSEAALAGDLAMVALCDRALAGDRWAWWECDEAIGAAQAMGIER
ncbi:MAG TPA: hypothetical protein VMI75_17225 [Polyangiaceae bacterium]|nr:hypothetical protein [Polyangiaceae bacterium]